MDNLRVTLVQANLQWEDIPANLEMFSEKLTAVSETDVIILPEMFSTGFSMNARKLAEDMDGTAVQWMKKTAAGKNCVVTGSIMIKEEGRFYNRLFWVQPDGNYVCYDKRHLFSLTGEETVFTPGDEKIVVEWRDWKICPLICYDLRFPVWSRNKSAEYDLLLYVANWPERRSYPWKQLLVARAIENQSYVVGVNRVGNDGNDVYHSGDSMAVDALGNIMYHKVDEEDVYTITISKPAQEKTREQFQFLRDADDFELNPKAKFKSH